MGGWALDARIYWQVKEIVFFLAGWCYPFDNNLLFFFFQTSQLDKDRGWVWAWSWPCPWPRGIHRWWDWRGPLLFDGRVTLPGRVYVYVYETIPGKKHMWLPGYPPPRLVVVCSWLGYAMLLLCFFFFDFDFIPPSVWPHTASFSKSRSASIRPQGPVCIR